MKVVIFCGGKGYRVREETEFRPKPLINIGGRPILWHIMSIYAHYGFSDFILCLGYKGDLIRSYFLNYLAMNNDVTVYLNNQRDLLFPKLTDNPAWRVTLINTGEETMTGARLKRIEPLIDSELFMLTYGDGLANINLKKLVEFHKRHQRIGTITGVNPSPRFGELIYERSLVKKFSEKPHAKNVLINGGFFIFDKRIFEYVTDDETCVFEKEPLQKLAEDKQLSYFYHDGFWHCLDTYRDMEYLNRLCHQKKIPWKVW